MAKHLEHPYTEMTGGEWLRGNLHTHTTLSDGSRQPQEVVDDYANRGYDFLSISDHDVYTHPKEFNSRGMVMIGGNEITGNGPHILHVNATNKVKPHPQRQHVINDINAGEGFAVVAHANLLAAFDYTPITQMREWIGYIGLEVYNGISERLHGSAYCTSKWDILLTEGRRLWGFSHDDSHTTEDMELGWNMVYAHERSVAGILNALRNGRFYPSPGVTINDIKVNGNKIRIETAEAQRIVALRETARRFAVVDDSTIEVEVPADATYVRFECYGRGGRTAWTQPFFLVGA
jgi:hypothetical protein